MTEHNETNSGKEEQTASAWIPFRVEEGRVTLRRTDTPAEPSLVREAREQLERLEDTVRRMESKGWAIEESDLRRVEFGKAAIKEGKVVTEEISYLFLTITATATVEGHTLKYELCPKADEWRHMVMGLNIDFPVERRAPAPHVMSPETALRLVEKALTAERHYEEWELWQELAAECGPGEEPDREEFKRVLEKYRRGELSGERRDAGDGSLDDNDFADQDDDEVFVIDLESSSER